MSTRCQVVIKDGWSEVWFYRHSDGYPEGVAETLNKFLEWVKGDRIRDNAEQASGWLVILGHQEYGVGNEPGHETNLREWKVGAYEPCPPGRHRDTEYLYIVDLAKKEIRYIDIYEDPEQQLPFPEEGT